MVEHFSFGGIFLDQTFYWRVDMMVIMVSAYNSVDSGILINHTFHTSGVFLGSVKPG